MRELICVATILLLGSVVALGVVRSAALTERPATGAERPAPDLPPGYSVTIDPR
jgi:hypothetical protein